MSYTIKDFYGQFRRNGRPAAEALRMAKEHVVKGTKLYSLPYRRNVYYSPQCKDGQRWVENASDGLRFTGECDKIATRLHHTGWFIDEFQSEKYQGGVWQLPSRNRIEQYVIGYIDPWNDDCALIDFSDTYSDKTQAAYAADRFAEKHAEDAREYNEAYHAGQRYADAGSEIRTVRLDVLKLLQAIKSERSRKAPEIICTALVNQIRSQLSEYSKLKKERAKLVDDFNNNWQSELWSAFNDGAGEKVIGV